ncbi:hypothetical protein Pr1d_12210 [Bythopirellula goksoeyrii]|uniref:Uncharacterized protein n=1 Tax=Bythopirellula goksoeyrii TaxID=1400387 RepID=A0A5B9Q897_9BACT|nr:hypothetical protein Pr1d_12210 [Bythopirellula goksoeyrii]
MLLQEGLRRASNKSLACITVIVPPIDKLSHQLGNCYEKPFEASIQARQA